MATLVVDASIAVKWFVEEQYFEFARVLHSSQVNLRAPTLLVPEIGNAFLKKVRRGELTEQDAGLGLGQVPSMVSLLDTQTLAQDALSIALRYQRSLCDSLYVAPCHSGTVSARYGGRASLQRPQVDLSGDNALDRTRAGHDR